MTIFEFIFYPTLLLSTLFSIYLIKTRKDKRPNKWFGRLMKGFGMFILFVFTLTLWSFQVIQVAAPKGTKLHEATRLPSHMIKLAQTEVSNLEMVKVPYGEHERQYVMLCRSTKVEPYRKKAVFYLHGGGWHVGSPQQHLALAEELAHAGYLVVMGAYRLGPVYHYESLREDISNALLKALEVIDAEGCSTDGLILGGTSAGANLAALLMYDRSELAKIGIEQNLFKGFFSMAGALDIAEMPKTQVLKSYAGDPDSSTFCEANPVNHFQGCEEIPVICIHGDKDGLVHYEAALSFINKLRSVQCSNVELHTIEGGTHLGVASAWYYDQQHDHGQAERLLSWMEELN